MNYSIIKVEGLSMKPFLISSEYVLVESIQSGHGQLNLGTCLNISDLIHRLVLPTKLKGDRNLCYDSLDIESLPRKLVIGRVLKNEPVLLISNYQHPALQFISKQISKLSNYNVAHKHFRKIILINIILLSKTHRFLEKFFTLTKEGL